MLKSKTKLRVDFNTVLGGIISMFSGIFVLTSLEKTGGTGEDVEYSFSFESNNALYCGHEVRMSWSVIEPTTKIILS